MKNLLKSTTSLTLCVALIVPGALPTMALAQSGDAAVCGPAGEQDVFPCAVEDGTLIENGEGLAAFRAAQAAGDLAAQAEAEAAAAAAAAEQQAAAEQAAAEQAAAEAQAAAQAQADAAADQAAAQAAADEEAAAAAEAAQAAEQEAAAAAQAEADAAQATAEQAEQQAAAEAAQAAELENALQAEQDAAAAEAQAAEQQATEQAAEEAAPVAEPAAETPAPAPAPETAEAVEAEPAQESADVAVEAQPEAQVVDEEAEIARQAERQAEREVERAAAQKALEEETAEVTTEQVTTEDTRKSSEDFATSATGTAAAPEKDDGLSKLEKALLLGLGAAVVGTVLRNGSTVRSNSGDRVVVEDESGQLRVLKDDDALLRRPGDEVRTEQFSDGSTRQTVEKPDGSRIVTIRGSDGTVLRRIRFDANGNETVLFNDLAEERAIIVSELPRANFITQQAGSINERDLREALIAEQRASDGRSFSLRQIREVDQVRALAPPIELDAARFASGSAAIEPEQARNLVSVGNTLRELIADDPRTVFLIEGHTDAVGDATYNLALSDRRAETIALALTEYFDVPPENMITQGYGESALKVQTELAEQANRRAVVRNITGLLRSASR
ncbi:MAG: OmpA family protein [Sulfitobacter sp.]